MTITTWDEFIAACEKMKIARDQISLQIAADADALRRAALEFLFSFADQHPDASLQELLDLFDSSFHITYTERVQLESTITRAQARLASIQSDIYDQFGASGLPYSQLQAQHSVDFPSLDSTVRNRISSRLDQYIHNGLTMTDFIQSLRDNTTLAFQARTLAETAVSQFANDYTMQIAETSGTSSFFYFGQTPQRHFCITHYMHTYTDAQIAGMTNGQGLTVRSSCGGYNCRHMWVALPSIISRKP